MNILSVFNGFSVDNLEKAKDFYIRTLGFDLVDEHMGLRIRLPYGTIIFIYEKQDHTPASYTMLNLVVDDIDASIEELRTKGVTFEFYENLFPGAEQDDNGVLRSPDSEKYGPSIAWFKDPSGNTIALIQSDDPIPSQN